MGKGSGTCTRPALTLGEGESDRSPAVADSPEPVAADEETLRPFGNPPWVTSCRRFCIERGDGSTSWRVVPLVGLELSLQEHLESSPLLARSFATRRHALRAIGRALEKSGASPLPSHRLHRRVNAWLTEDGTIRLTRFAGGEGWWGDISGFKHYSPFTHGSFETRREAVAATRRVQASLGLVTERDAERLSRRVSVGEVAIEWGEGLDVEVTRIPKKG